MSWSTTTTLDYSTISTLTFSAADAIVASFTFTFATGRVISPPRTGKVTITAADLRDNLAAIELWLTQCGAPPLHTDLPGEYDLACGNKLTGQGARFTASGKLGGTVFKGEYRQDTDDFELDARQALDLSAAEFRLFIFWHRILLWRGLPG